MFDAEMLKAVLLENEIECIIQNNSDSAYPHLSEVKLLVPAEKTIEANHILKIHYSNKHHSEGEE